MPLYSLKHHYKMILVFVGALITNVFAFSQVCSIIPTFCTINNKLSYTVSHRPE